MHAKARAQLASLIAGSALLFSASALANNPPPPDDGGCTSNCGYERGPDPTEASLEADSGPYSVSTSRVSSYSARGFGGGTIYYPTNTTGTMAAIVVIPGYVSYQSSIAFWGSRLASHGFVVMTIDTNSIYDQPDSRRDQIDAALDYLISQNSSSSSPVRGKIDPARLAAVGWSMGGGGTLQLASGNSRLSAAIGLAPWNSSLNNFDTIQVPTLIFACENDSIAPVSSHASPFYNDIPSTTDKAYFEMNNGDHYCANGNNSYDALLGKYGVSWMKLHLDKDERYEPFLCGPNHTGEYQISEHRSTCPY